ncbi:MAG: hypothetical protein CMJ31_06440, partial [Phycisphaerae bacterium]|nr:hypothetical protein [Phycisphaerae bacterium]
LPTFSGSLDRYLWVPSLGDRSPMAAVTRGSPEGDTSLEEILTGVNRAFEPFNLRGGHVFVRRLHPLTLESLIDVVGGAAWSGVSHGTRAIMLDRGEVVTARGSSHGGETIDPDRLYLGRHGRWGRLVETLHLKLRLLTEAMSQTREVVARTGRPLFNITAEAFEADLHDAAAGLPRLWTAGVRLAHAGTALEIRLGGEGAGGAGFVVAPEDIGRGVYKPVLHAQATGGVASLLVRAVTTDGSLSTIESTLRSQERLAIGRSDLVALRLSVGGERVSLYAKIEEAAGLAAGEARLRTLPAELSARASEALSASQGVVIEGVRFDVLPSVSTPCDLHAMGVLCVRTLLVDGEQSLPMALDEVLSLATLAGEAGGATAAERIESVFMGDGRWAELLGPHRLVRERVGAQESLDLVPPDLWFETLGFVARLFPGRMAGAFARDLGDAPAKAAHRVFDAPLEELDHLLVRTRSLVVIDWKQNREVHGVLRRFQEGLDRAEAPVIPKLT